MKRRLAIAAVALCALLGVLLFTVGTWLTLFLGADGAATTALGRVTSTPQARAIVIDVERVTVQGGPLGLGRVQLVATSPEGGRLAVTTGEPAVLDELLAGVPYDAARFDGETWTMAPVPGGVGQPPWDSADWTQRSVGDAPSVSVTDDSNVVIGRADARSGVTADLVLAWRIDGASRLLPWFLGVGVALIAAAGVGGVLLVRHR